MYPYGKHLGPNATIWEPPFRPKYILYRYMDPLGFSVPAIIEDLAPAEGISESQTI